MARVRAPHVAGLLTIAIVAALPLCAVRAGTTTTDTGGVEVIVTTPDRPLPASARKRHASPAAVADAATPSYDGEGAAAGVIRTAMSLLGTRYLWGGTSPSGFDCSGFVQYVFRRNGIAIPRTADVQFAAGRRVTSNDPQPGDLVFFQTYDYGASHVGIYLGEGQFVNAIGSDVHIATFDSPYFRGRYLGARRFL